MSFPEQRFQIQVVDTLKVCLVEPARFWATPNGGLLPGATKDQRRKAGALRTAMGVSSGFPDLCVMWPGGICGIELKAPRPASVHLEPEQKGWRDTFEACGFPWAVCRSWSEVETFLRSCGAPMRRMELAA